jgi:hypothetical protein
MLFDTVTSDCDHAIEIAVGLGQFDGQRMCGARDTKTLSGHLKLLGINELTKKDPQRPHTEGLESLRRQRWNVGLELKRHLLGLMAGAGTGKDLAVGVQAPIATVVLIGNTGNGSNGNCRRLSHDRTVSPDAG